MEGEVVVQSISQGQASILDSIPHKDGCSLAPPRMPTHLRTRTWARHERATNARLGLRGTLASGAVGMDGDGRRFQRWRLECKQTGSDYYTLTQASWTKLVDGALNVGEEPVLDVEFLLSHGRRHRRVVIRESLWTSFHPRVPVTETRPRWRIPLHGANPEYVGLVPPGIAVDELDFLPIKEQLDQQLP